MEESLVDAISSRFLIVGVLNDGFGGGIRSAFVADLEFSSARLLRTRVDPLQKEEAVHIIAD